MLHCEPLAPEFSNCSWFYPLLTSSTISKSSETASEPLDDRNNFLSDNHTQHFLERYFEFAYMVDVGGTAYNDICLVRHSNGLFLIGLAPGHVLFRGCDDPHKPTHEALPPHRILGLDYQISRNVNRLENCVRGKKKRGAQILGRPTNKIAFVVCDRGVYHPVFCGLPGRLIQVNPDLVLNNQIGSVSRELKPFWGGCSSQGTPSHGTYIAIISPTISKATVLKRSRRVQSPDNGERKNPNRSSSYEKDIFPKEEALYMQPMDKTDNGDECDQDFRYVSSGTWTEFVRVLTDERLLPWDEYSKLRSIS